MTKKEEKAIQVPKLEVISKEGLERTRDRQCYLPKTDIYEIDGEIIIVADLPGVDQKSIEITLEKNILTINTYANVNEIEGFTIAYSEYEPGDFQRSFRISDEIDRDKIEALVTNGELRLRLPKAETAKTKKIAVKAG